MSSPAYQVYYQVPQARQNLRGGSSAHLRAVLVEGHIPYPVEAVLDAHVRASDKITVLRGWGATAFEDDGDRVRVDLARGTVQDGVWTATGETDTIAGRYLVGADGATCRNVTAVASDTVKIRRADRASAASIARAYSRLAGPWPPTSGGNRWMVS